MPFPYDDDLDNDQNEPKDDSKVTLSRRQINALEKAKKEAEARAAQAERQLAFAKAGIDPEDSKMKYFVAGYEGEIKAEDIKKAAVDAGFLTEEKPPEPKADNQQQPHEGQQLTPDQVVAQQMLQAQQQVFGQMAQATTQPDVSGVNYVAEMKKIYESGGNAEDVAQWMRSVGYPVADDQ